MFKRLILILLAIMPIQVMAANIVIWHAAVAGNISGNLGLLLKARIESTTEHTVQNRFMPGDGGWLAVRKYIDNGPDNSIHLLIQNADKLLMGELMHRHAGHEKMSSLTPVASLGRTPYVILVGTNIKASTIKDLDSVALPAITTGSVGAGSFGHLVEHTIGKHIKTPTASVFYKGGSPALTDLIGNHLHMYPSWPGGIDSAVKGLTKAIAVSRPRPELPGISTLAEQGITEIPDASTWVLVKNAHLTPEQTKLTQDLMQGIFNDPEFHKEWSSKTRGVEATGDPQVLSALWKTLRDTYTQLDQSPDYAGFKDAVKSAKK